MHKRSSLLLSVLMASSCSSTTLAQSPWRLYPSVGIASDYRYNGVSYSDGEPALQLSLHASAPQQFYFGVWSSQVDFNDPGHTSYEVDAYIGRTFEIVGASLAVEALYTFFPDKSFPGPTYDFLQGKIRVSQLVGRLTFGGHVAWTSQASYAGGTALRTALDVAYEPRPWFEMSANLGRRWIEHGVDRTFWDAGATLRWRRLALDLRYADTNLDSSRCARCEATATATLTANLW